MPSTPQFMVFTTTAADDNIFNITTLNLWFEEIDIFCYTNPATVGTISTQNILMAANAVYTVKGPVCAKDLIFLNTTPGSNTTIVISGTALSDNQLRARGLM